MAPLTIASPKTQHDALPSVLIVDDDPASGAAIQEALWGHSFPILGVERSPNRLLWAVSRSRPGLVIVNIRGDWPEGDLVMFQLTHCDVAVLLVGDRPRLFQGKYRLPEIHRLPRTASAAEIANALRRMASLD